MSGVETSIMDLGYFHGFRNLRRDVRLALVAYSLNGFAFVGIYSMLFNLYLLRLGYSLEAIGMVNASGRISFTIFSLPAGLLGGKFGVRKLMIIGECIIVAGLVLAPFAELLPPDAQRTGISLAFALSWVGGALFFVNMNPFIMRSTTPDERSYTFAAFAALIPLAGFLGNLMGGYLPGFLSRLLEVPASDPEVYRYPLLAAGLLTTIGVAALFATKDLAAQGSEQAVRPASEPIPYRVIFWMALVILLITPGQEGMRTFFNVYLDDGLNVSTESIGGILALVSLISVPTALVSPWLIEKLGNRGVVLLSPLVTALGLLPIILIPHWFAASVSRIAATVMFSVTKPAMTVYTQGLVPARWQAAISGSMTMAMGMSGSIIALGGGYLIPAFGYQRLFFLGGLFSVFGALVFWVYFRTPRGEYAKLETDSIRGESEIVER